MVLPTTLQSRGTPHESFFVMLPIHDRLLLSNCYGGIITMPRSLGIHPARLGRYGDRDGDCR